ncbi:MAG: hypothetical protein ACUVTX_05435, partial [Bacteroidales bacterium]
EYTNYATGFQHYGFIIDNEGNILSYNKPEKWNFPDKDKLITQLEIEENLSSCTPVGRKISGGELQKYVNYIDNIAASKVSAPRTRVKAANAGTSNYYCYLFSESNSEYKVVTVKTEGEIECENLNFYSRRVIEWMRDINSSLHK